MFISLLASVINNDKRFKIKKMTAQEILNSTKTKTRKMQLLFELGHTRTEVARMLGTGYGFVQNVYARTYPDRIGRRARAAIARYTPTLFNRKFGIEIECYGVNRQQLIETIRAKGIACNNGSRRGQSNNWKITTDGSISGRRGAAVEVVSPILRGADGLAQLEKVCEALTECRALINKTCGLHVHFDANHLGLKQWKTLFKNYIKGEGTIDSMMPRSRRGNGNRYIKSMINKTGSATGAYGRIERATTLKGMASSLTGRDRYYKLNVESFFRQGSVEFRQHSGTREFSKMKNWILFLHRLVDYSEQGFLMQSGTFEEMGKFMEDNNHDFYHNRIQDLAV